ncbi:MAG: hypothetical protein HY077_08460 [Elusimicrobia bacterium]|nr:hypothetical protein [Elusimicrobiota bacterium]
MRRSLIVLTLFAPLAAAVAQLPLRAPIEIDVTGFKASLDDGRVVANWRRYKRTDFASYKIVKSSAKEAPVFPDDPAVYSTDAAGDTHFEDGKLAEGTWRYRLCIVTRFGDLWVSRPVTLVIDSASLKRAAPTAADFEGP